MQVQQRFVLVDFGLFSEHADEVVLGVFVFLGGYAGVIAGCSSWAKAKGWNDAIVFIGLIPVCILVLPFVRGGQAQVADGFARYCRAHFRVGAEVADEDDFVDRGHGGLS